MGRLRLSSLQKRRVPRRHPPFFRTKKLALVGNTGSRAHTPWFDPSWTIAAHPCVLHACPKEPDWWFDMHGPQNFRVGKEWSINYLQWLQGLQTPIFMQQDWPDIPMAVEFPKQRVLAEFRAYFTNHVAWMIALAMTEGVTHLGLFGCEYSHDFERGQQRGSAEFWLGMFEGGGGHVILPPGCSLLNDPSELYGYESHDENGRLIASYRPKPRKPQITDAKGPNPLTILYPETAEGRIPLAKPPEGEAIAWERSGHLLHV